MPPSISNNDDLVVVVDDDGAINVIDKHANDKAQKSSSASPPSLLDESMETGTTLDASDVTGAVAPEVESGPAAEMSVMGVYKRGKVPREKELPEDYALKDCAQDQIMVRERLNTRPLFDDDSDEDSDDESGSDADDESDNNGGERGRSRTSRTKSTSSSKKASKKERTKRSLLRRLSPKSRKNYKYDVAMFQPEEGLVMEEGQDWPFYHADLSEHSDSSDDERVYDERAILWQSIDNYETLMGNPAYSKYFLPPHIVEEGVEVGADGAELDETTKDEAIELILDSPRFGEQVIVKGISAPDIAIGDIFEVEGGHSTLKVEVSSPRLPCSYVDKRNGAPFGMKGVKRYTMTEGLAGWFTRVLVPGELRDGMRLVRTAHPHPKWTLPEISMALYGEGPKRRQMLGYPYWSRSRKELQELCNLKALGRVEWKDEAKWILDGNDSDYEDDQLKKKEEAAAAAAAEEEAAQSGDFFNLWLTGSLAACCTGAAIATLCTPIFGE